LTLLAISLFAGVKAQGIEWSFQVNSGPYRYHGNSSVSSTFLTDVDPQKKQGSANNPYGSQGAFSYGAGFQAQWVSKSGFFAGLQASFDVLRSKAGVDTIYTDLIELEPFGDFFYAGTPATGKTYLVTQDIN